MNGLWAPGFSRSAAEAGRVLGENSDLHAVEGCSAPEYEVDVAAIARESGGMRGIRAYGDRPAPVGLKANIVATHRELPSKEARAGVCLKAHAHCIVLDDEGAA